MTAAPTADAARPGAHAAWEPVDEAIARAPVAALLRVHLSRSVAVRTLRRLVERCGSVESALRAVDGGRTKLPGLGPERAGALRATTKAAVDREQRAAARLGVCVSTFGAPDYPAALYDLVDPPLAVYTRGTLRRDAVRAAVIGSRRATPYARRIARSFAEGLAAAGAVVVSGLARGVDAAAHEGALAAGGRTVAVLGCGVDVCYPPEHAGLLERCAASGAVLSEHPLGTPPLPQHFPRRNRLIAALSRAVCVVSASERSGSLTTASWALDLGREVLVCPHRIGDPCAAGALRLLRDGAQPAIELADLLAPLGLAPPEEAVPAGGRGGGADARLSRAAAATLAALTPDPAPIDALIVAAGLPVASVYGALLDLEQRGLARRAPCGGFQRTS